MRRLSHKVCSLVFLSILVACNSGSIDPIGLTPTAAETFTTTPTAQASMTPLPTKTPLPGKVTPLPPLPTLPPDQAKALIQELLETNGSCKLPCWWGITPGELTWTANQQFLTSFVSEIIREGPYTITDQGFPQDLFTYNIYYPLPPGETSGYTIINVIDNLIDSIIVYKNGTENGIHLSKILAENGKPTVIIVYVLEHFLEPNQGSFPFELALYYPDQNIIATYFFEGQKRNGVIFWCAPQKSTPELFLWAPDVLVDVDAIVSTMIGFASGFDTEVSQRHLEDFTNMNIDEFYQAFVDPNSTACLESPVDLWE